MAVNSRLRKLEAFIANRQGRITVMRLALRHQGRLFDSGTSLADWHILDPGEDGSKRRAACDLTLTYTEAEIWERAERAGLTEELKSFLGRGPMTAGELAEAERELAFPLSAEEFAAKVAAERLVELRQAIVDAAATAGVDVPAWLDKLDDLTPEQEAEAEAWLAAHMPAVEQEPASELAPTAEVIEQD